MPDKRLMIFIDGSNLFYGMDTFKKGFRLDILKLIDSLTQGRDRIRTYYYASQKVPPIDKQTKFYEKLSYSGIQCTIKDLRHNKEKGVDVALATDFLAAGFKDSFDVAIIVSGDQDYDNAIREVKSYGKVVEVAAFRRVMSQAIRKVADKIIFLDDIASMIELESIQPHQ